MKFSILIPVYKPQFLKECIDSVVAQTYQDWELILVNDASPHDLDSIISQYDDPRIRYRKREKGFGARELVKNWNDCLKDATGDYVMFPGDDDSLTPCCLQEYYDVISRIPGKALYHARTEYIDENGKVKMLQKERPELETVYDLVLHKHKGGRISAGEFLYHRETFIKHGGFYYIPYAWGADDITSWEMAKVSGCGNCRRVGFRFRDSQYSITSDQKVSIDKYEAMDYWERWYREFIAEVPTDEEDQKKLALIIRGDPMHRVRVRRMSMIDKDIQRGKLKAFFYWWRRLGWDKKSGMRRRTLLVFLYYAYMKPTKAT